MKSLPNFSAIAAFDEERGLGKEGDLPWHLPEDLKHFATTTTRTNDPNRQNGIIMGRVTCESIPPKYWPLPGRKNVVITRNPNWTIEGATVVHDLPSALYHLADSVESIFVVGGGQIYTEALKLPECHELYLTRIAGRFGCDAFFPTYENQFERAEELTRGKAGEVDYVIERWQRR